MAATGLQCSAHGGEEVGDNPLSRAHSAHWLGEHQKWQLANSIPTLHTFLSPLFVHLSAQSVCGVGTIGNHEMGTQSRTAWRKSVGGAAGRGRKSLAEF